MSLIQSLKSKIIETKKDISNSFISNILTTNTPESNNYGFDILQRYRTSWAEIHNDNEKLSQNIQKNDIVLLNVCQTSKDMHDQISRLHFYVSSVESIFSEINAVKTIIEKLNETCTQVEKVLLDLDDLNEDENLEIQKSNHNNQLQSLKDKRCRQLELSRYGLEEKYKQSVRQHEQQITSKLAERQQVFSEAHRKEMEIFRNTGCYEKNEFKIQEIADISQIVIDQDSTELEMFLQDQN